MNQMLGPDASPYTPLSTSSSLTEQDVLKRLKEQPVELDPGSQYLCPLEAIPSHVRPAATTVRRPMSAVDPVALVKEHRSVCKEGGIECAACVRMFCEHSTCLQCGSSACLAPTHVLSPPCEACVCQIEVAAKISSGLKLGWFHQPGHETSMRPTQQSGLKQSYVLGEQQATIDKELGKLAVDGRIRPGKAVCIQGTFVAVKTSIEAPHASAEMSTEEYAVAATATASEVLRHAVGSSRPIAAEEEAVDDGMMDSDLEEEPGPLVGRDDPQTESGLSGSGSGPGVSAKAHWRGGRRRAPLEAKERVPAELADTKRRLSAKAYAHGMQAGAGAKEKEGLVYDMRPVNRRLRRWPFRYTSHSRIFRYVKKGYYIASADVKSGFHHIYITEGDQCYFGIRWGDEDWVWTRMPFGLGPAPAIFSTLSGEVVETLQRRVPIVIEVAKLPGGVPSTTTCSWTISSWWDPRRRRARPE